MRRRKNLYGTERQGPEKVDDEEVAACIAVALGCQVADVVLEPLVGKQGLLIMRARVAGVGSFVFKAVRESGRREIALTSLLAHIAPGSVPAVVACEEDTRRGLYWIVTEDMGEQRLADVPTAGRFCEAARALAGLQMASIDHLDRLRAAGVRQMAPADWEDIALGVVGVLEGDDAMRWSCAPDLDRAIWATGDIAQDAARLPSAIIHGDLHAGNVAFARADRSACLLDWGSAYIGAAFLALEELLLPAARYLRPGEDSGRVRAAYVKTWSALLGKPGWLDGPLVACQALVRLELLDEALRRPGEGAGMGVYAAAAAGRRLVEAWRAWERARGPKPFA